MRYGLLIASLIFLATAALATESALSITRAVYIEQPADNGTILEPANTLRTGDKVVLVLQWDASGNRRNFTLASKVPTALAFQNSSRDPLEVSVDGGHNWGRLGALRIGDRLASPEDVTHLRWQISASDVRGIASYSAIVR